MSSEKADEDVPDGYRRIYIHDEFDTYISAFYGLEVDEYIRIIDTLMTENDALLLFDYAGEGELEKGQAILKKYI